MKTFIVAVSVLMLSGCFAFMPQTKPATLSAFDGNRLPPGDGWSCFTRVVGKEADALCYRTLEECSAERSRSASREEVLSVGVCESRPTAHCYVAHRESTGALITDPSQLGDKAACFETAAQCEAVHSTWVEGRPYGITDITACGEASSTAVAASGPPAPAPANMPSTIIKGQRVSYARNVLFVGKDGASLTLNQAADPAQFKGQVELQIEGALKAGAPLPVRLSFMQVEDSSPKAMGGVRNISSSGCGGTGTLTLKALPTLPKKLTPGAVLGSAQGVLDVDIRCAFELAKEFGKLPVTGPVTVELHSAG